MVNAMTMIDFTECCHQGEYLQDIDRHSRDSKSLKQYLECVILMWLPNLYWRLCRDTIYENGCIVYVHFIFLPHEFQK
jgi:hypothetical protein